MQRFIFLLLLAAFCITTTTAQNTNFRTVVRNDSSFVANPDGSLTYVNEQNLVAQAQNEITQLSQLEEREKTFLDLYQTVNSILEALLDIEDEKKQRQTNIAQLNQLNLAIRRERAKTDNNE